MVVRLQGGGGGYREGDFFGSALIILIEQIFIDYTQT